MKVVLHVNNAAHQKQHVAWMREGFDRHGIPHEVAEYNNPRPCDVAVIWGWKQPQIIQRMKEMAAPILVMERGHLQPRMLYTSMGWNGLCNRATYPEVDDDGVRWREFFGDMEPWHSTAVGDYVLLCGQCDGDAALHGVNFRRWAQDVCNDLVAKGIKVVYRPHPFMLRNGVDWCPAGAKFSTETLEHDLRWASYAVTYNSTVATECVLAGVPTVTHDIGAMAWDVTSHGLSEPLVTPDRTEWAHKMAWCQWHPDEIRSGEAWAVVREAMP